jgi:hypothetical protein
MENCLVQPWPTRVKVFISTMNISMTFSVFIKISDVLRDYWRSALKTSRIAGLAMSDLTETCACVAWIFIKKKNRRNEGQWFDNNPLELVFERENYTFVFDQNKQNRKLINQGWAKLAPWVELAPALQKATVEIFAWTFFCYVGYR